MSFWPQTQCFVFEPRFPQGQGFMAQIKINLAGNRSGRRARATRNYSVFKRLAQGFDNPAFKFGKFVQKQNSAVGQSDFSGFWPGSAADERDIRSGVMGIAERSGGYKIFVQNSGDAVNGSDFKNFFKRKRRKNGAERFREHCFARAGRADHQNIVAARGGDFQSALGGFLSFDIGKINQGKFFFIIVNFKICRFLRR